MEALRKAPIEHERGKVVGIIFRRVVEIGKAVAMLPFYCGYATDAKGEKRDVHDHGNVHTAFVYLNKEHYDPKKHGELEGWLNEGDTVTSVPNSKDGKTPIHRHGGKASSGVHEYKYE